VPAIAYLRKSVVHVDDPKNSAEAQEAAVRAMATRYGENGSLVVLSDWDKSGRLGRSKRPGYDALWRAVEDGTATAIYSYSMSRLARSVSELTRLFETCAAKSIPIRLEADVVDTSTASGRMTAAILASVAAFEADVAGERMRAAMQAKAARGERIGTRAFYGDKIGEDADVVLAAFREAGSLNAAARLLNERRIPCRGSRRGWWASSVRKIIVRLDPSALTRTERGVRAGKAEYLFARLLHCGTCGTTLTPRREGQRVRYNCHFDGVPHPRTSIAELAILPAIQAEVAHLRTPEAVEVATGDEAERTALEARRARIIDMREAGQIDRSECDRRLAAVSEALERLSVQQEVIELPEIDWTWPPAELNKVLRALFERIDLDPLTFQPTGYVWTVPEWRA
jgi:DNA invertase Pin-like site-specific DNA recombinase